MIPFIREQVGHYAPIVAVDSSEKMLREASLRFPNAGVRFVRADVERDRLGGRFNAILLYSVFPHFRYPVDTIARLVTDNLYCGGRLLIAHSQSREQLNEMHKRISDKVFARDLLPVAEQVAQFTEIGLSVASFDETDEYYYILLQRVGRKLSASVADAIYYWQSYLLDALRISRLPFGGPGNRSTVNPTDWSLLLISPFAQ